MIPRTYLDDLLAKVDLPAVVGRYVPDLKRTGSNYSACCPFHAENTPSFTVTPSKGFYHCFGCGAHGSAIGFLMEITQCGFVDAVETLSGEVGMEMPKLEQGGESPEKLEERKRFGLVCATMREAQRTFAWWLRKAPDGTDYLNQRGITQETIEKFGIGYAPNKRNAIADGKFIDKEGMLLAGLVNAKSPESEPYDRFRNRVMFPIYHGHKNPDKDYIVGFGGRAIGDQEPKYLNSPETLIFKKGENLYGLKQALGSKNTASRVFVVEGYMDAVMLSQYEVDNVVATMGTAVTDAQIKKLLRISAHVTFCMDGDGPGRRAAKEIAEALLPHMNNIQRLDLMLIPDNMDPDEFVRDKGAEAFFAEADKAKDVTEFLVDGLKEQEDTSTSKGMAHYLATVNEWAEQIQHSAMKLAFKKYASDKAGISLDAFLGMSQTPAVSAAGQARQLAPQQSTRNEIAVSVGAQMLGIALLRDPRLAAQIEAGFLEPFLTLQDKEMLLPLLAYIKTNPDASKEAIAASLAYNPHENVIKELVKAAHLVDDGFDATSEAKIIINEFRKMRRVWDILDGSATATDSRQH